MRHLVLFLSIVLLLSCSAPQLVSHPETANLMADLSAPESESVIESREPAYEGKTIDQIFPVVSDHDFMEEEFRGKRFEVNAAGYTLVIRDFRPHYIEKESKRLLRFSTLEKTGYWSSLVGVSSLLGRNSKQIYVAVTGPGAVCCTHYWIVDVTDTRPRTIYRSEDFGDFRDAMEIFDNEGDGVFELVQFDSCMRYFRDDCGSCSPEPRAYFAFDKKKKTYKPAKGLMQDFVRASMKETEKGLEEKFRQLGEPEDATIRWELTRWTLSYVADLLHLGLERKAWKIFDRYDGDLKDRRELKRRLRSCRFYQALREG
jgi:hypothetical protein